VVSVRNTRMTKVERGEQVSKLEWYKVTSFGDGMPAGYTYMRLTKSEARCLHRRCGVFKEDPPTQAELIRQALKRL